MAPRLSAWDIIAYLAEVNSAYLHTTSKQILSIQMMTSKNPHIQTKSRQNAANKIEQNELNKVNREKIYLQTSFRHTKNIACEK